MRLLIDTHILLWALAEPHRLPAPVRGQLEDPANEVLVSAVSLWEIAIKFALGRADFTRTPTASWQPPATPGFASCRSTRPPRCAWPPCRRTTTTRSTASSSPRR